MELVPLSEALDAVPDGAHLIPGAVCGTPTTLLGGLNDLTARRRGLTMTAGLLFGDFDFDAAVRSGGLGVRCWHVHGRLRRLWREGLVTYLPMRSTELPTLLPEWSDVALIRVGPPDADGWCNLGPSTAFVNTLVENSRVVVAEVCDSIPRTLGEHTRIHASRITAATRATASPPGYTAAPADERARRVAESVVGIIPRGATLQLGIGAITDALVPMLEERVGDLDLGLLGMLTEDMIPLAEAVISSGRGPIHTVDALGGERLLKFLDNNPGVHMSELSAMFDVTKLGAIPRYMSINSAMAVDLQGQVVAETVRGRVVSGLGGSIDFFDGARLSPGGIRVIAMPASRRDESTILARHHPQDLISVPHHGVDAVVTEHGVAWLRGRTQRQRAEALISVADPSARAGLLQSLDRDHTPTEGSS